MPTFEVDDQFHSHEKTIAAGNEALGVWVKAGSWSAAYLTDGRVPADVALRFGGAKLWERLVAVGLVEKTEVGFQLHDFLHWNRSAKEIATERARAAAKKQDQRAKKRALAKCGVENGATVPGGVPASPSPAPSQSLPIGSDLATTDDVKDEVPPPVSKQQPRAPKAPEDMGEFELVNAVYFAEYEKARGTKPPYCSQDGAAVKRLLKSVDMEKACELIRKAFADEFWRDKFTIQTLAKDPARFDRQVLPFPGTRGAGARGRLPAVQDDPNWQPTRADATKLLQSAANGEDDNGF